MINGRGFFKMRISLILLILGLFWTAKGQDITPTENLCHADVLPHEVISLLQMSSARILREWNPSKESKKLNTVVNKLQALNDSLFIEDQETKGQISGWEYINMYQKRYGNMLSTVLNTNLDLMNNLDTAKEEAALNSAELLSKVNELLKVNETLNNLTNLLEDIYTKITDQPATPELRLLEYENIRQSREIEEKSLELQEETHFLVKTLVDGKKEDAFLKDKIATLESQIDSLTLENTKLESRLKKAYSRPADCHDIFISGIKRSGFYKIYPYRCYCSEPIEVWCDMKKDGGGWTVLLKRKKLPSPVNFTRSWREYEEGFGDPLTEYWIGNANLHALTSNRQYTLKIDMKNRSGKERFGQWNEFFVSSAQDNYELHVGGFSPFSTISKDVLRRHNKQLFSTYDSDNDASYDKNCAEKFKGGWWYGRCFDIHPTGILLAPDRKTSVSTSYFYYGRKSLIPLKQLTMKIKPKSCVPHTLDDQQKDVITCTRP